MAQDEARRHAEAAEAGIGTGAGGAGGDGGAGGTDAAAHAALAVYYALQETNELLRMLVVRSGERPLVPGRGPVEPSRTPPTGPGRDPEPFPRPDRPPRPGLPPEMA